MPQREISRHSRSREGRDEGMKGRKRREGKKREGIGRVEGEK